MSRKVFKVKIAGMGPNRAWSFFNIPFSVEHAFGSKARVAVRGTISGRPFRSSVFPWGDGRHHMMLNKRLLAAEAKLGDVVRVFMEKDTSKRTAAKLAKKPAGSKK